MKFIAAFALSTFLFFGISAAPLQEFERSNLFVRVDPGLVPQFGVNPITNPTGTGQKDFFSYHNPSPVLRLFYAR